MNKSHTPIKIPLFNVFLYILIHHPSVLSKDFDNFGFSNFICIYHDEKNLNKYIYSLEIFCGEAEKQSRF